MSGGLQKWQISKAFRDLKIFIFRYNNICNSVRVVTTKFYLLYLVSTY